MQLYIGEGYLKQHKAKILLTDFRNTLLKTYLIYIRIQYHCSIRAYNEGVTLSLVTSNCQNHELIFDSLLHELMEIDKISFAIIEEKKVYGIMKSIGCLNSVETFVASEFLIKERNAVHFVILIIQSNK